MVRALRNSSSTLGLQYLPSFSVPLQVTNEKILPSGSTRPDHPRMSIWKLPLDDSAKMAAYSVGRRISLKPDCPAMDCTISAVDASMELLAKVTVASTVSMPACLRGALALA